MHEKREGNPHTLNRFRSKHVFWLSSVYDVTDIMYKLLITISLSRSFHFNNGKNYCIPVRVVVLLESGFSSTGHNSHTTGILCRYVFINVTAQNRQKKDQQICVGKNRYVLMINNQ